MARKATPPRSPSRTPRIASTQQKADASAGGGKSSRERVIATFMTLLAEKSIEQIGLADIAPGAGISLAELRTLFSSKLAIYAAAAGIDPSRVILVMIDAGTDNEALLNDPLYVGVRHARTALGMGQLPLGTLSV